ncbi:importin subunit beta-1-like [Corticium candelabrum]|uniref:importin subunit beta-1-like n=1 Tax=Corticium candelabrum TaxID=121492 RepID=UPI002E2581D3|nr:importin subunit beta-1-like [Corticium candelabrum]
MELYQVLEATTSTDKVILQEAERCLGEAAESNLPGFLVSLSAELANVSRSSVVRFAAGLQLKNYLTAKDAKLRELYQQRWLTFDEALRSHIKHMVLQTLGSEGRSRSSAAQCVAYIACAELPNSGWPELIPTLVQNCTATGSTENVKEACMEAIGYICEELNQDVIRAQANLILTAVIQCMRKEEPSSRVRLAGARALLASLDLTKANFEKESERHFIMQVVCEATQSTHTEVKVCALQNLVKIMSLYYQHMETYMGPALFAITLDAMKSDIDEVALQGIEFWSTVCDEETDLVIEAAEAADGGYPPRQTSRFYVKGALQYLVPILMLRLTQQEEFDDEDEWNPCKAAGVCLSLMANCCENEIVRHVIPFVKDHVKSEDWKFRDAAILAFGAILEGPDPKALTPLVIQAMPTLIEMMKDVNIVVQDTVAWTIGRVCGLLPEAALKEEYLMPLLEAMCEGLDKEPRVASNICWAFSSLAEAAFEAAEVARDQDCPTTYCLSPVYATLVQKLLHTADRSDGSQSNLRSAAYEALMEIVKNSPKDCYATVQETTLVILQRLNTVLSLHAPAGENDRAQVTDMQSLLCATLQSVIRKMNKQDVLQIADNVMTALLRMMSLRTSGILEDALMATGSVVEVLGPDFIKYFESFKPFLLAGLSDQEDQMVCQAAVGVVGDLSRSLQEKLVPYCHEIVTALLNILSSDSFQKFIKPQILAVFGDIALGIGLPFTDYLQVVMGVLQQASQLQVDKADYDMVEYLNELRESCIEGYTGIVQGLSSDASKFLLPYLPHIGDVIEHIALDLDHTDSNTSACCGLLGDLLSNFGSQVTHLISKPGIQQLIQEGKRSQLNKTKKLAMWASKELRKLAG